MEYEEFINYIAVKENTSAKEIENEINYALKFSRLNCSAKQFISEVTELIKDYI